MGIGFSARGSPESAEIFYNGEYREYRSFEGSLMDGMESDCVERMFAAISRGDMAAFKTCFTPGALIWHNDDEKEQDVDAVAAVLGHLHAASQSVAYEEQRIVHSGNVVFVQHVLRAPLTSGNTLRLPAMMRIELGDDGRVARIEEYFDSRATDCLQS